MCQARVGLGNLRGAFEPQGFLGPVAILYRNNEPNEVIRAKGEHQARRPGQRRTRTVIGVDTYRLLQPTAELVRLAGR